MGGEVVVLTLPPLKCRTPKHNLHQSKSRSPWSDSTLANKFVLKNQSKKVQARGKTCFLQHTQAPLKQKSEKVHRKKAICDNERAEKSVEKMQARGWSCFLHHTRNHRWPKSKKRCPKNETYPKKASIRRERQPNPLKAENQ